MTDTRFTADELDELLGAFALDAVDPDERQAVEDYLRVNPRARAEVEEHREVAAQLAFEGGDAPAGVWSAIQASLDQAPPEISWLPGPPGREGSEGSPGREGSDGSPGREGDEGLPGEASEATVIPIRKGPLRAGVGLAVATAAAILVAAGFAVALGRSDDPASSAEQAIAEVEDDPDAVTGSLVSTEGRASADAGLSTDGLGYVDGTSLPALDEGRTYQLWGVSGDLVISLGVLGADPDVWVFESAGTVDALAVTDEAVPGVVSSDQPAVVVGELT